MRGLEVSLETGSPTPGAPVRGTMTVRGGGEARALSVALCYRERADYAPDVPVVTAREISEGLPLDSRELTDGSTHAFSLRLPEDAMPNYRAMHGELWWELEARWVGAGDDATATARVEP